MQSAAVDVRHKLPPLKALTSVRFFAAMYVVLFHDRLQDHLTQFPLAARFIGSGYTSVTLFFVLSGFILAYNYPTVKSSKSFWIARFARVYPVYLLATVFMLLVQMAQAPIRRELSLYGGTLVVLALVQAWWPRFRFFLNEPAWTLSVEAFFYVVFPFLIGPISRMRRRTFVALQAVYIVFVCLPFLLQSVPSLAPLGIRLAILIEGTTPIFRLNSFVVGVYLGARWARSASLQAASREPSTQPRAKLGIYLALGTVASIVLLCTAPESVFLPLRTLLLTYTYALVVAGLAATEWRILTNHTMQVLGEISYGVYILQLPMLHAVFFLQLRFFPSRGTVEGIQLVLILPVAYVIFRWVEIPARLLIRRVLTGQPVPTRPV